MKNLVLVLSVLSVLAFTSCKKAGDKMKDAADTTAGAVGDAADATEGAVGDAVDATAGAVGDVAAAASNLMGADFSMPSFDNADLNQWAQDFMSSAAELKDATTKDPETAKAALEKFNAMNVKLKDFQSDPQFKQAAEFAQNVASKLDLAGK